MTEGKKCIGSDRESRTSPGNADYGEYHDHGCDQPAKRHVESAEQNPQDVQEQTTCTHRRSLFATEDD
jgi:hypothetical protein